MTISTSHSFAPIAPAPYALVSVVKSATEVKQGRPQVSGICAHCGSHLINVATFRAADGTIFTVGVDCAKLAGESVTAHAATAKVTAQLDGALAAFRPIARAVFVGCYMDVRSKDVGAATMKSFVKLGLVVSTKHMSGCTRYYFTTLGVELLSPARADLKVIEPPV